MSLSSKLASFKQEVADATSRNLNHSRPASNAPPRTSTPKPAVAAPSTSTTADASKRTHDDAFNGPPIGPVGSGQELLTQVHYAIDKLKSNKLEAMAFDDLISYLSLPNDAQRRVPVIKRALQDSDRVEFIPKSRSGNGKECFRYRPKHPVTNAEELKNYLAGQTTAQGILVKELKDGWPDCISAINELEKQHFLLATRNKKDNTPKMVWPDSPSYHTYISDDFREFWAKTKLPATETEIRNELEKAGITPTSQVKEVNNNNRMKKDRKRPVRRGGKTTNNHMLGILKDYTRR
jgi:transcription initiation factor TFIIE subunit beta